MIQSNDIGLKDYIPNKKDYIPTSSKELNNIINQLPKFTI